MFHLILFYPPPPVCVFCMTETLLCLLSMDARREVRISGTGVTDSCELHFVGAGS